jgi:hypothetical protein
MQNKIFQTVKSNEETTSNIDVDKLRILINMDMLIL